MRRFYFLFCCTLFLEGCGLFEKTPTGSLPIDNLSAEERQSKLQEITHWGLKGKISIRSENDGANASIVWDQEGDDTEVRMFGAFGIGTVRVVQNPGSAILYRSGEKPLHGENAEELLLWEFGLRVPIANLRSWLRGLKGNGYNAVYDSFGRLKSLQYTDVNNINWLASFDIYRLVKGNHLPIQMSVKGGGIDIKVKTDSWLTEEPEEKEIQRLRIPGVSSLSPLSLV